MPRPSSPLDAKASVRSPYALDRSQQNSCVGTVSPAVRKEAPSDAHTCALIFCQTMMSSQVRPQTPQGQAGQTLHSRCQCQQPAIARRAKLVSSRSRVSRASGWWSQTGSNRRPHACKARALPTELWPLFKRSRLSESCRRPVRPRCHTGSVVGPGRLELPTSRLSGVCSNQLSYGPMAAHARPESPRLAIARDRTAA